MTKAILFALAILALALALAMPLAISAEDGVGCLPPPSTAVPTAGSGTLCPPSGCPTATALPPIR